MPCASTKHCRGQYYSTSASIASEDVLFFDCNYTAVDRTICHTTPRRYYYYYYYYYDDDDDDDDYDDDDDDDDDECTLSCAVSPNGNI